MTQNDAISFVSSSDNNLRQWCVTGLPTERRKKNDFLGAVTFFPTALHRIALNGGSLKTTDKLVQIFGG